MTANQAAERYDVIVAGGGPAGSCTAGLLALAGRSVLLLERDKFPRYHIGESLITGVWPTLDRLGVREQAERIGFVRKYGANVRWGNEDQMWGFEFRDTGAYEYAYQVRRAEFDAMLLGRARDLGVTVLEDAPVREAITADGRVVGVRYQVRGEEGLRTAHAPITVDASGQQRWLGRQLGLVRWHEDLRNIAVWAYFQGCQPWEGERAGYTLVENMPTDGGWFWYIPLGQDTVSIGYVTPSSVLAATGLSPEDLFESRLAASVNCRERVAGATRVSGFRTARDWSYTCRSFHGPGWVLVGDAAAFVDPLLSTGVSLAVRAARIAADAIDHVLDSPVTEAEALSAYEQNCKVYLDTILEFVRYFYDATRTRFEYHHGAQQIVDPQRKEPPEFDFVQLVSGLAKDEPLVLPVTASG
jgi:flavin-dependent dehydrogenase